MNIKGKIYFENDTGNVILHLREQKNVFGIKETTIEQDVKSLKELSERNRDTFDVLELEYGAHTQDFAECDGYRVNPETKELEFSYPVPGEPDAPQVFGPPLTEQIEELRLENSVIKGENEYINLAIIDLWESIIN